MKKEFVMRGKTPSGTTEVLNFSGFKPGMAYRMTEFKLYPTTPTGTEALLGSVTASKTAMDPESIDFNDDGLIAVAMEGYNSVALDGGIHTDVINDTFLITQNLILMVKSINTSEPVNWQCKFMPVKMAKAEEAVTNYKQYLISDGS